MKQRLVTWTPRRKGNLEATTRRISTNTKGLVTWVPKLDVKIANEKEKVIFENNRIQSLQMPRHQYKSYLKQKHTAFPYQKESVTQASSFNNARQTTKSWTPSTTSYQQKMFKDKQSLIRPKKIFYNNIKSEVPRDLVWNGKQFIPNRYLTRSKSKPPKENQKSAIHKFDPIPLSDVVPTSIYALDQIVTKDGLYRSPSILRVTTSPTTSIFGSTMKTINLNSKIIKVLKQKNKRPHLGNTPRPWQKRTRLKHHPSSSSHASTSPTPFEIIPLFKSTLKPIITNSKTLHKKASQQTTTGRCKIKLTQTTSFPRRHRK